MPPYPPPAMRRLAALRHAGPLSDADSVGESGAAACGDLVRMQLAVRAGRIERARFLAFGCGAATAAGEAACELLSGASLDDALRLSPGAIDAALGGLGPARRHGPEIVADAAARALESWFSSRLGRPGREPRAGRVAVAMSGGVDSAVAALILRDAGHDVVGVTMRLWHDPAAAAAERSCCSPETVRLARAGAHALGIPHLTLDVAETFRREVVGQFVAGYAAGRTPNPCVTCNGTVRFRVLAEAAALLGAAGLATGHYARVVAGAGGEPLIARAADEAKDQSYMLAALVSGVRRRLLLPLGDLRKDEVRRRAREAGLPAAEAVESQDVCFVGAGGYRGFLERAGARSRPGDVLDREGRTIGRHDGHWRFTVGQRRGLGIAAADPLYVLATDAAANTVTAGPAGALDRCELWLEPATLHEDPGAGPLDVRIRHRGATVPGRARRTPSGGLRVALDEPARAVAPGQTAALYRNGRLVAAGTICASTPTPTGDDPWISTTD